MDLNGEAAEKAAAEIESHGGRALAVSVDVADESAITTGFEAARRALGPV